MSNESPDAWGFPQWLVCYGCKNPDKFGEAKEILQNKYGFVYSPFELDDLYGKALVLPRPDVRMEDVNQKARENLQDFKGWGIGRVRFGSHSKRGPSFDIKYFLQCPWEYMESNPMRAAAAELYSLLEPTGFIDENGENITFPYI